MSFRSPFPRQAQLCNDLDMHVDFGRVLSSHEETDTLPGYPLISMNKHDSIIAQLKKDSYAKDLETIAPKLWIMTTFSGSNINPLHKQKVKGREIIITEDPRLHLVWIHDRIFIKPLPRYMLCYRFWETISTLQSPEALITRRSALGLLRSYIYLIRHELDLQISKKEQTQLLPSDVTWSQFCRFMLNVQKLDDDQVSGRYQYGELRLSRLNFYAPFLLHRFYFEQLHGQYGDIFGRFYGPLLFIFAIISTMLNALQVAMAVESVSTTHWLSLWAISRWFSVVMLFLVTFFGAGFCLLWCWFFADEWIYTLKHRRPWPEKKEAPGWECV